MKNETIKITATDKTKAAFSSVNKSVSELGAVAFKITGAIGALGAGVFAAASHAASLSVELNNISNVASVSVPKFQKLSFAAKQYGIDQEKLSDILKDTNDKIGDFIQNKSGPMVDFFNNVANKVGITAESFKGLSSDDALGLYVRSLEEANLSQQDMTFYMESLASDSIMLLPLLTNNAKALGELSKEAEDLGLVMTDFETEQFKKMGEQMTKVKTSLGAAANIAYTKLAPFITNAANAMLDLAKEAGGVGVVMDKLINYTLKGISYLTKSIDGYKLLWKGVKVVVLDVAATTLDYLVRADQALTELLNKLPGNVSEISRSLMEASNNMFMAYNDAYKDFQKQLSEPPSSEGFNRWIEDVKSKRAELTEIPEDGKGGKQTFLDKFIDDNRVKTEEFNDIWQGSFNTFTNGAGDAMASVIVDQKNGADAMQAVMRSVVKGVISGIGQIMAKKTVLFALEKLGLATTAAAGLTTAATLASAYAAPAALVSLASFGGNSIPASAGITSTIALTKGLALAGVAHDGLSHVPQDGTYLLQGGEKVVSNKDSTKLDKLLESGASNKTLNLSINISAVDPASGMSFVRSQAGEIVSIVQKAFDSRAKAGPMG